MVRSLIKIAALSKCVRPLLLPFRMGHTLASEETEHGKIRFASHGVDFSNVHEAYQDHSSLELLRTLAILRLCRSDVLVRNATSLIETAKMFLGNAVVHGAIRRSFFKQFCPGTNNEEALETMRFLRSHGIGSVFDRVPGAGTHPEVALSMEDNIKNVVNGIECAALDEKAKMAAVKLANFARMESLERISTSIRILEKQNGMDVQNRVERINAALSKPVSGIHSEDIEELDALKQRLRTLANVAEKKNVRLLIDAEESEITPALDYVTLSVMETENQNSARIWNTYQCYLKDAEARLMGDMENILAKGCSFGVKLVRGAYLTHETELSQRTGRPFEIFDTKSETDACYDRSMELVLDQICDGRKVELCLATHNQTSIEKAIEYMQRHKMDERKSPVYFAQIYGMRDFLTYTLGHEGYKALKLLVFGDVQHVVPFLLRRAQENSSVTHGSLQDIEAIQNVLKGRVFGN